jgi:luciferase family oxidoreductase group 1
MIPFSVLDLSPINEGESAADALRKTLDLAQQAERLGFNRFWLAEHHNMAGIASAATAVVIGHVASGTKTIRVGAGGVMLPNHAPLVVAEQFGTLASLYPERIDLGLGRAPGADQATSRALRRDPFASPDQFPEDVIELLNYFGSAMPPNGIRAIPGTGLNVPIWLLGSSLFGARLAALLGLPYAFASHFAPDYMTQAIEVYRNEFRPSEQLGQPYLMLTVNVLAADTDAIAHRHFTSQQRAFLGVRRGKPGQVPSAVDSMDALWAPAEKAGVDHSLMYSFVGSAETVSQGLRDFIAANRPDELMITAHIHDQTARLHSLELVTAIRGRIAE